jgi:hypothetical protein
MYPSDEHVPAKKRVKKRKRRVIPEGQPGWDAPGSPSLIRHNERKYRERGWVKGRDGVWRPPASAKTSSFSASYYGSKATEGAFTSPFPSTRAESRIHGGGERVTEDDPRAHIRKRKRRRHS